MKKIIILLTLSLIALGLASCSKPEKTIAALKTAIDGETAAGAKYALYADRAEQEGHYEVAALFRATSQAEDIHVKNHMKVLNTLGVTDYVAVMPELHADSTLVNLKAAMEDELYQSTNMYPRLITDVEQEKIADAATSFRHAAWAEQNHAILYTDAIASLTTPGAQASAYFICPVCGNVYAGNASEVCEICGAPQSEFVTIHAVMPLDAAHLGEPVASLEE